MCFCFTLSLCVLCLMQYKSVSFYESMFNTVSLRPIIMYTPMMFHRRTLKGCVVKSLQLHRQEASNRTSMSPPRPPLPPPLPSPVPPPRASPPRGERWSCTDTARAPSTRSQPSRCTPSSASLLHASAVCQCWAPVLWFLTQCCVLYTSAIHQYCAVCQRCTPVLYASAVRQCCTPVLYANAGRQCPSLVL